MPCYDSRSDEDARHNSKAAEELCKVLKKYTPEQIQNLPKSIQEWWEEHQKRDL